MTQFLAGRFLVTRHARQRMAGRQIRLWQIEAGINNGKTIRIDEQAEPNPTVMLEQALPDGTSMHVVWAWLPTTQEALLVTAYVPDEES